ncbi:MAG TPA: efflux RND transporter periplasmic adaptor subunit, partial [Usitatibacter sp.]
AYLLQDMTVSVDIEVARRPAALSIPLDAVRDLGTNTPWVLVALDGQARRRAVKLGAHGSSGRVEVLEGLALGERVIPATETVARDGKRLRPA